MIYVRILLKYRIIILACVIIITTFFGYYAMKMSTDNSIDIWLSKNDKDMEYYKAFLKKFGERRVFRGSIQYHEHVHERPYPRN